MLIRSLIFKSSLVFIITTGCNAGLKAQPGLDFKSITFRVFDPQGKLVTPANKKFVIKLHYQKEGHNRMSVLNDSFFYAGRYQFLNIISQNSDRLENCRIEISNGSEKMIIYPEYDLGTYDSIPFTNGIFHIPNSWMHLLNTDRAYKGATLYPQWKDFEDSSKSKVNNILFEKFEDSYFGKLFSTPSASYTKQRLYLEGDDEYNAIIYKKVQ